ncbi:MAG: type II toxin-antitoxin system VapC family toxin [Candidatus Helarchaeota archaeon]
MIDNNRVLNILLDTNFLLIPFQFKVNLKTKFDELIDRKYNLIILNEIYDELVRISKKAKGKRKIEIQAALTYYKSKEKKTILNRLENESVDDLLLRIAKENNYIVATNDKLLKRRLKKSGINFIYLCQKAYFKAYRPFG